MDKDKNLGPMLDCCMCRKFTPPEAIITPSLTPRVVHKVGGRTAGGSKRVVEIEHIKSTFVNLRWRSMSLFFTVQGNVRDVVPNCSRNLCIDLFVVTKVLLKPKAGIWQLSHWAKVVRGRTALYVPSGCRARLFVSQIPKVGVMTFCLTVTKPLFKLWL